MDVGKVKYATWKKAVLQIHAFAVFILTTLKTWVCNQNPKTETQSFLKCSKIFKSLTFFKNQA